MATRYSRPKALCPGDAVAVIAPAGRPDAVALDKGLAKLSGRYEVHTFRDLLAHPWGMLAGSDSLRKDELNWALEDPRIRCVIAARGGYGTARIIDQDVIAALVRSPKLIVGFSDLTALLCAALSKASLVAIHGPMVCQLGRVGNHGLFSSLCGLLESVEPPPTVEGLEPLWPGTVAGPIVGGNLTVLTNLVGTHLMPDLDGAILVIEDVGERPYRIDRCLGQLLSSGALDNVAGIVAGTFVGCDPVRGELPVRDWVAELAQGLDVPSAWGLEVGHGEGNLAIALGARAELDAAHGRLVFLEPAVQ